MVSNQLWVICPMFGKTGIRGQEYGKKIMRDPSFLAQKATDATEADQQVIT